MEYAYAIDSKQDDDYEGQVPKGRKNLTMVDWERGEPAYDTPQKALTAARKKYPRALVMIAEVIPVTLQDVRPTIEQLLADMKEKLVAQAGEFADRQLENLGISSTPENDGEDNRTDVVLAEMDEQLGTALETIFDGHGIKLNAFKVRSPRTVQPGQAYA